MQFVWGRGGDHVKKTEHNIFRSDLLATQENSFSTVPLHLLLNKLFYKMIKSALVTFTVEVITPPY